jgi:hypothetical protein
MADMKTNEPFDQTPTSSRPLEVLNQEFNLRGFLKQSAVVAAGCAFCLHARPAFAAFPDDKPAGLISPGCRKSKVRVAKIYLGKPKAHWPTPNMDIAAERQRYEAAFARMQKEFADVEFVGNELVTTSDQVAKLADTLKSVDGILAIHLAMGIGDLLPGLLASKQPVVLFAAPYSGHEWAGFGALRQQPSGERLECLLTSDLNQLAVAVRPFRALHHLREAKVLNLTTRALPQPYVTAIASKFGTQIQTLDRKRMLDAYESIPQAAAEAETNRWIRHATKVVEPPRDEIFRSCKLALAFQKVMDEEQATVLTVDCYGSMYRNLPAFPCVGFVRLNSIGLGGICESDLQCAMTHIVLQGLSGKPGFVSDPTLDAAKGSIILAHCLGSIKMAGPDGEAAPYKLRTIMERQEGCVPQVKMRLGQKVTQAILIGADQLIYFTGDIIETPDVDRGCRTKITVKVDGDLEKLWQNWSHGLHRVTCYGDLVPDLKRFCRFTGVKLVNEA